MAMCPRSSVDRAVASGAMCGRSSRPGGTFTDTVVQVPGIQQDGQLRLQAGCNLIFSRLSSFDYAESFTGTW